MFSGIQNFGSSNLAHHIGEWIVLLAVFAFAGTLGKWSSTSTKPFVIISSQTSRTAENDSIAAFSMVAPTYPYFHDTVSTAALLVVSIMVPFLLVIVHSLCLSIPESVPASRALSKWRLRGKLMSAACLGVATSIAFTLLLTEGLKTLIAKQRPDFMGRCGSILEDLVERFTISVIGNTRMVTWEVCESYWVDDGSLTKGLLKEGWRSFPSGHSSLSLAGMTYVSLYLANAVFRINFPCNMGRAGCKNLPRPNPRPHIVVLLLVAIPILAAMYICTSRYSDFKHEGIDIFSGAVIGLIGAVVGWNLYGVRHLQLLSTGLVEGDKKDDDCRCVQGQWVEGSQETWQRGIVRSLSTEGIDVDMIQVVIDGKA